MFFYWSAKSENEKLLTVSGVGLSASWLEPKEEITLYPSGSSHKVGVASGHPLRTWHGGGLLCQFWGENGSFSPPHQP